MQDPHCSQLGHITGSLRPEHNLDEQVDKKVVMVMMMMRMMSRFLSQKEVAWWSVSLGTHCHYLLSISITLKTIRKKLAQKLLIVFIISTPGLKLSLDLVLL